MKSLILLLALSQPVQAIESPCLGKEPTACELKLMDRLIDKTAEGEVSKLDLELCEAKRKIVVDMYAEETSGLRASVPTWLAISGAVVTFGLGVFGGLLLAKGN